MKVRRAIACGLAAAMLLAGLATTGTAEAGTRPAGDSIAFRTRLQRIDGLGFAEAFQRATTLRGDTGLSPQSTQAVLNLLFDRRTGAGASIVRIGIGSSTDQVYDHMKTIEPVDPGGPDAKPRYVWDGDDGGQVWFAQQAQRYGVRQIMADAWSAPGFMKTTGTDINGGNLCGVPDTACASWHQQAAYSAAIEADPIADRYVDIHTGHGYASPADTPLPTDRPTWLSEWGPAGSTWNESWDDNSGYDGLTVAQNIHTAFALGQADAYVYWVATSLGATKAFIQLAASGDGYRVSKRYWAFAAYSRFIRPNAYRVPVQLTEPGIQATAFRNADGSMVVELINTTTAPVSTSFALDSRVRHQTTYVTDGTHSLTPVGGGHPAGARTLPVTLSPRALTTVVLR
jgi:O-glycosyl hydrolase